jgi:peptide/nickel transport system substrate-binding protein
MRFKLFSMIVLISLILTACGGAKPPAGGGGGTATLIIPEEPTTLNFFAADAAIVRQVAEATSMTGLTTIDDKGDYEPVLALDLPSLANGGLSQDYLTVTWKLKPDLKWSDGKAITSDDIKFTWEVLSNPNSGVLAGAGGFNLISSVDTPDPLTAVLKYTNPYPAYLNQFAYGLLPRHATGKPEDMAKWAWDHKPVGAGPFLVSDWQSGQSITMERNPNYYEAGKPFLDKLIFRIIPEPSAQTAMMLQGEGQVHLWPGEQPDEYAKLLNGKAKQVLVPGIWNMAIDFNLSAPFDGDPGPTPPHPILGDIRVRQAIASGIDYDKLIHDVLKDSVSPSASPFEYGWAKCDTARPFPFDPEKAKQLLDQAGWVAGSDGIRVAKGAKYAKDGTRLSLEMEGYTNYDPLQQTEEFIVENLKAIGVEAHIQNDDFSIIFGTYQDKSPRMTGDFDMLIFDRGFGIDPQEYVSSAYRSDNMPSEKNPTGANYFRWNNPTADDLLKTAGTNFDQATRRDAYCKLAQEINKDLPQVFLYLFQDGYGFADNLTGYTVSTWGSMTWGVQNWKYK